MYLFSNIIISTVCDSYKILQIKIFLKGGIVKWEENIQNVSQHLC